MIRPISLFLLIILLVAFREKVSTEQADVFWVLFLLCIVPCIAVAAAIFSKRIKNNATFATFTILLSWGISVVVFSWAATVHSVVQGPLIVDGIVILTPAVFWLVLLWFISAPIPSRIAWVSHRIRVDILLLFIPVFFLLAVREFAVTYGLSEEYVEMVEVISLLFLVGLAPFFIASILSAKQIKNYELRSSIAGVGRRAGVKQSKVLVWNTHNRIMNAIAIGIFFQPKIIVLTDKLIANLTAQELLAVSAHEFGHHKYWHIPFLIITAVSAMIWSNKMIDFIGLDFKSGFVFFAELVIMILAIIFVSRQFERQADAYAAVDISKAEGNDCITPEGVHAMVSALGAIAQSENIQIERDDPMHGSIVSRQQNLHSLVGCTLTEIPINKRVMWLKIAIVVSLALGILA